MGQSAVVEEALSPPSPSILGSGYRVGGEPVLSAQFQPAHVPAGHLLRHHTHQCVFCFLPNCLLTFPFFFFQPIRQNGFSLIVQGSFHQPAFVTPPHLLHLCLPLLPISGAIYTETFLLTLGAHSPLLQSASLSVFLLLSLIRLLFFRC